MCKVPVLSKEVIVLIGLELHERVVRVAAPPAVNVAALEVGDALARVELAPGRFVGSVR